MAWIWRLFKLARTTVFLTWMCISLALSTISLAAWAAHMTFQVASLSAHAASAAVRHRKQIARAVAKTKAKARLRRMMVAVPVAGIVAAGAFERSDYLEWKEENPDGDLEEYSCEVATISAEVIDEVLQEMPEVARPSPEFVLGLLSECELPGGQL